MPRLRLKPVLTGLVVVLLAAAAIAVLNVVNRPPAPRTKQLTVPVAAAAHSAQRIAIDATIYYPVHTPASAVLVSPGFGGDKNSVATDAQELAQRGFVALAYTPRGFGRSGGQIGLNSPDLEVADAQALISLLARDPAVRTDRPGDPRVGVTGGSYGGALALMLAGTDHRVDAVTAAITYHDLGTALLPNNAGPVDPATPAPSAAATAPGVFKRAWAGNLFAAGFGGTPTPGSAAPSQPVLPSSQGDCGRFSPQICQAYTEVATTGAAGPATLNLLRRNSPVSYDSHITAPTMLVQGERDTLFGLDQAQANAAQIAAAGTTVKTVWYSGGHDGGLPTPDVRAQMADWLAFHLDHTGPDPGTGFSYAVPGSVRTRGSTNVTTVTAGGYPGLAGGPVRRRAIGIGGPAQLISNPPGGAPPSISNLPGVGAGLGSTAASRLAVDMPGQSAMFGSAPLPAQLLVAGAPTVDITVAGTGGVDQAVLFAKLYDVAPDGTRTLPGSAVAPIRVTGLRGGPQRVSVTLPGIAAPVQSGHRLMLAVSTTDSAYASPGQPYSVRVSLSGARSVAVPVVPGRTSTGGFPVGTVIWIGVVLAVALLAALVTVVLRRRRDDVDRELAEVPVSLRGLTKVYGGKLTVVDDLSFTVLPGQVVGLLGPNGAGKTTALRILLGLVNPTAGEVRLFGHRIRPGAPVLSRVGAFVERSGFLPHLSGRANLELYWRATGRPAEESQIERALEIADLGAAVRRRVGTYSQGMRQRLAIAQAMLGLPELLILDEPTNGLDPPQIHHMRSVLRDYAATGRTVLVSSHLLAEVEQTCTHVVVMHRGRLVADGPVDEVVAGRGEATFAVDAPERAVTVLRGLPGVTGVQADGGDEVHAVLDGLPRSAAVRALVDAEVGVQRAGPRRRLEDAFLQLVGDEQEER